MSLVGNFAFSNYDKTAESAGSPPGARQNSNAAYNTSEDSSDVELSKEKSREQRAGPDENGVNEGGEEKVHELAQRLTQQSISSGHNPFEATEGSLLDPRSANFSARAWAKSLLQLQSRDPEKHPQRTSGIAFQNLSVHGFGSATDYQKTVANIFIETVGLARKLMGTGHRKIQILRDFDGVLNSGEMLMVLGPPGSGCSTLLKTIAGETHGLFVGDKSYVNYQGGHQHHGSSRASLYAPI